ncbi:MAG: thiol peroxidase [Planctomycetes bacterium]|nr:thiol peroxidase [Planctomycetota bacterium]
MCTLSWIIIGATAGLAACIIVPWIGRMIDKAFPPKAGRWIGAILCVALGGAAGFWLGGSCHLRAGPAGAKTDSAIRQLETTEQFDSAVIHSPRPVVVDFYATWCSPCRQQAPIMDELAGRYAGKADFVKVDVDKSPALAQKYGVQLLPTIVLFADGKPAGRWEGVTEGRVIASAVDAVSRPQPSSQKAQPDQQMIERAGVVTGKGKPMTLLGPDLKTGMEIPDVPLVANDMLQFRLSGLRGKKIIVCTVPSLDTAVCSTETRKFNEKAASLSKDVEVVVVSMDLPFAQARWCGSAGIDRVRTLSDYRGAEFGKACGLLIKESRLLARCVFIADPEGKIRYIQLVPELAREPDYDAVFAALAELK